MADIEVITARQLLGDRNWRWVTKYPEGGIRVGDNQLTIHGMPTDHGYYPKPQSDSPPEHQQTHDVIYTTKENGIPYRGWDIYCSIGSVSLGDEDLPAYVVDWPAPEFMIDTPDSTLFLRVYAPDERLTPLNF